MLKSLNIGEIAKLVNAKLVGDATAEFIDLASLQNATSTQLTYAISNKFIPQIKSSNALAIITTQELSKHCPNNVLISDNPYLAFATLTKYLNQKKHIIHPTNIVGSNCNIGKNINLGANSFIGDNVKIGDNCYIANNASILDNCIIGDNCTFASGSVIGSQGFGNAIDAESNWHNIFHSGGVKIGDNVNIGVNSVIDSGTLEPTIINNGVQIDNLVHIAHNVQIGENCAIAARAGIAGSSIIGKHCQIGGMVGIVGHLIIADNVIISATSTVNQSISKAGIYTGFFPILPHQKWKKTAMLLTKFVKIIKYLNIKLTHLK